MNTFTNQVKDIEQLDERGEEEMRMWLEVLRHSRIVEIKQSSCFIPCTLVKEEIHSCIFYLIIHNHSIEVVGKVLIAGQ